MTCDSSVVSGYAEKRVQSYYIFLNPQRFRLFFFCFVICFCSLERQGMPE